MNYILRIWDIDNTKLYGTLLYLYYQFVHNLMKIAALLTAKKESSLKNKNILKLLNKSLIEYDIIVEQKVGIITIKNEDVSQYNPILIPAMLDV